MNSKEEKYMFFGRERKLFAGGKTNGLGSV